MVNDDTDRNLLFGVLALQNNIIDHQALIGALRAWSADRSRPLAGLLKDRGALAEDEAPLVEMLVARHLKKHGGNPHATLGAVAQGPAREAIRQVDDPDVRRSLLGLPALADDGPDGGGVPQGTLMVPATGQRSRHTLSRVLAEGGLGKVWVARDTHLNRDVALKEILPEHANHPEAVRRFYREAQVTGQLEHPNIVPVYELDRRPEDDQPFYTMRLVGGRTMAAAVARYHEAARDRGPDPAARFALLQAFVSVCQAVGFAHSRGVVHRDLKPLNVMLGDYGETVVIDWGLAKLIGRPDDPAAVEVFDDPLRPGTQAGQVAGSPSYMAPEQAEGRQDLIDQRTDVYGLGAVLFEVLTGRPPYSGGDSHQVLAQVINGATPRARDVDKAVPPALDAVCGRAMARDREARYATATELALDLQRWMTDEPVSAYREGRAERLARWARRHRSWTRAGAAALVVIAVVSTSAGFLIRAAGLREKAVRDRETARLTRARLEAQDQVFAGQADTLGGRWDEALLKLTGALNKVGDEPALADLRARAAGLLAETDRRLAARRAQREARARYDGFRRSHDDALFHGTMFVGLDPEAGARTASALAREALGLYGVKDVAPGPLAPDPALSAGENGEVKEGCYELLLLMAETEAGPGPPGTATASADPDRLRRALRWLDRAAGLGMESWAYHARRSDVLARLGDEAASRAEAAKAESVGPAGAFDHFLAGRDAYQRDRPAEGVAHLDRAVSERPDDFWAQYLTALALLKLGRPAEARAYLTACLGLRPGGFAWCYLVRGYADSEVNDFDAAEADFRKALALSPDRDTRYGVLVNRGRSRILCKQLDGAVADLTEAAGLYPERAEALVDLALAHQARGDRRTALAALDRAVDLAPGLAPAYRNRARLRLEAGDAGAAARDLAEAIRREPRQPRLLAEDHTDLAALHFRAGRHREASLDCDRALEAVPDHPMALRVKAESLIELKQFEQAAALLDRYLARCEPVADVYRARGLLRQDLGRPGGAIEDFTRALEMAPDSPNILAKRGWLYTLDALKLARLDFDRSLALNPRNADAYNGRGYALVRLGEVTAGVKDAEEAVRLAPAEPVMLYNAACVLSEAVGRLRCDLKGGGPDREAADYTDRAVGLLRKALEQTPPAARRSFWTGTVEPDPALGPIRRTGGFIELRARFGRQAG